VARHGAPALGAPKHSARELPEPPVLLRRATPELHVAVAPVASALAPENLPVVAAGPRHPVGPFRVEPGGDLRGGRSAYPLVVGTIRAALAPEREIGGGATLEEQSAELTPIGQFAARCYLYCRWFISCTLTAPDTRPEFSGWPACSCSWGSSPNREASSSTSLVGRRTEALWERS
jgi:hypothetical protein